MYLILVWNSSTIKLFNTCEKVFGSQALLTDVQDSDVISVTVLNLNCPNDQNSNNYIVLISFFRPSNAQIVLTENTSGEDVTSTSFCFANRSACLDFIKSSLSIKASLALHENSILKNNTVNTEIKSQPNVLNKFLKDNSTA